jgi:Leucine-rich repeat (LRR) protein
LYLQNNAIPGKLPVALTLLKKLEMCNISHNMLNGHLPKDLGDCARLKVLRLTGNNIRGPVPLSMARLLNLKDFHIFKSFPAEDTEVPRAFSAVAYDRVYRFGTAAGMDHVHWRPTEVYGSGGRGKSTPYGHRVFESASEDEDEGVDDVLEGSNESKVVGSRLEGLSMVDGQGTSTAAVPVGAAATAAASLSLTGSLGISDDPSLMSLGSATGQELKVKFPHSGLEENSVFSEKSDKYPGEQRVVPSSRKALDSPKEPPSKSLTSISFGFSELEDFDPDA